MFVVNDISLISISPVFCATFLQPFFFYLYPISTPPSSFSFQSYFPFLQFFYITFLYHICSRHMQSETAYFYFRFSFTFSPSTGKIKKATLNPLCQRRLRANFRKGWVSWVKGILVFKNGVDNKNSLQLLAFRGT